MRAAGLVAACVAVLPAAPAETGGGWVDGLAYGTSWTPQRNFHDRSSAQRLSQHRRNT